MGVAGRQGRWRGRRHVHIPQSFHHNYAQQPSTLDEMLPQFLATFSLKKHKKELVFNSSPAGRYLLIIMRFPVFSCLLQFFNYTSYIIGGHRYSLQDIENGILRSNRKAVGALSLPFKKNDPRLKVALAKNEPLIHFALVCGAKSCPPIKTYSAEVRN